MPDRLPSLIVLAGFWVPPAVAGWVAAGSLLRKSEADGVRRTGALLATFVLGYTAAWFLFNLTFMPPYIPGAVDDPTIATPRAAVALAIFTAALILPGSALACVLAFRLRVRDETQSGIRQ
jgi:hypothetical protein